VLVLGLLGLHGLTWEGLEGGMLGGEAFFLEERGKQGELCILKLLWKLHYAGQESCGWLGRGYGKRAGDFRLKAF